MEKNKAKIKETKAWNPSTTWLIAHRRSNFILWVKGEVKCRGNLVLLGYVFEDLQIGRLDVEVDFFKSIDIIDIEE